MTRFREEEVALSADIECMFHQIRVAPGDQDAFRFLWWPNGDLTQQPVDHRMEVHLFGATSSPSCSNFALRRTAEDNKGEFSEEVVKTVKRNFYVDDCLKSLKSAEDAVEFVDQLQDILSKGGFRLAKWSSNRSEVMDSIPQVERAKSVLDLDLGKGEPPFTYVGLDYFGPLYVRQGRSSVKRYGCLFTCLVVRAVHIEVVHSLDTDSFINAVRRFINLRGSPSTIYSDNGSNFTAGERELRESLEDWNQQSIEKFLRQKNIRWKFNPPGASHMGGAWERTIRSVHKILRALLGQQLVSDEILRTLMSEVEGILNSRPLTPVTSDPKDLDPLTPNHLLLLRANPNLPPGVFNKEMSSP